jgi:hypothetical protein
MTTLVMLGILFFGLIPAPVWLLCVIFILQDLLGATSGFSGGVANLAHLSGAAFGFLYKHFDLRWDRLRSWMPAWRHLKRRRSRPGRREVLRLSDQSNEFRQAVSERMDQLLAKIHDHGSDSLTAEEWEFLRENSSRYRSS